MLIQVKTWIIMVLRFIDMISKMKQSLEFELGNFRLGFISHRNLHAIFNELMSIFRAKLKNKSCPSMSLGPTLKISASLEW